MATPESQRPVVRSMHRNASLGDAQPIYSGAAVDPLAPSNGGHSQDSCSRGGAPGECRTAKLGSRVQVDE
jgi:hypothetical protein